MPIVTIRFAKGRSIAQKRKLVSAVTEALVAHAEVKPEWVTVLFEEYDRCNWATAGRLHSDALGKGWGTHTAGGRRKK